MQEKRKVRYSILEDMKKYIKGFKPDDYEETGDETDERIISSLRQFYEKILPVDVSAWSRVNYPENTLIYKDAFYDQIKFVRDVISDKLIFADKNWNEHEEPQVIGSHSSKSVKLPVFKITREDRGIEFILRCNIYDWKISVCSKTPLDFDFMGLFDKDTVVSPYCCEGFPKDKVYGSYSQDHSKFTVEFTSEYNVYVFFFLLRNYLGIENHEAL